MKKLEALRKLLEKVEAGQWGGYCYFHTIADSLGQTAFNAFDGSMDAALSLFDAVLPGWEWQVRNTGACIEFDPVGGGYVEIYADHNMPARALLIAILKALISLEEGK